MDSNKEIHINGPVNFFRLKNKEKEIYIFFDYHINIATQTECDNYNSINIDKYLLKFFINNKENIDFFLEIEQKPKSMDNDNRNRIYLNKIRIMFAKYYEKNKDYQYLKLHYIDIRQNTLLWFTYEMKDYLHCQGLYNLDFIIDDLKTYNNNLEKIMTYIDKYKNNKNAEPDKNDDLDIIFLKIMTRYHDNKNYKNIKNFLEKYVIKKIIYVMSIITKYIKSYSEIYNKYKKYFLHNYIFIKTIKDVENKEGDFSTIDYYPEDYYKKYNVIVKEMDIIRNILTNITSFIMESYFLRRITDKEYIKKSIVYTGAFHSANYLWFLVKYYDFEITEYGFINDVKDVKEFEKIIKNMDNVYDIHKYITPEVLKQCSKIKPLFS